MAYICYRIVSYIHNNQDKCVEQALRILNGMDTTNNVFAQITITKLNKSIYLASDTTKTALGISSNIFELDSLTTDKDLVNNAISSSNTIASGAYDKLLNSSNVVLKDNIKTINGQSLIGTGDITITGGGSADLSNYYDKANVDTKLNAKLDTTTANSTYATKTELGTKLDANTEFKTVNGQAIKGTGNIEITGNVDLTSYYTKETVDEKLATKANVTDLANKLDSTALDTYKGEVTTSLAQKLDITTAETTYATKAELNQANVNISSEANNKLVKKTDGLFVDAVSNTDLTTKLADYTTTADLETKLTAKVDTTALETYKQEVTASLSNKVEQTALTTTLEQYLKKDQIGQVGGGITATWAEDTKTFTLKGITLAQI